MLDVVSPALGLFVFSYALWLAFDRFPHVEIIGPLFLLSVAFPLIVGPTYLRRGLGEAKARNDPPLIPRRNAFHWAAYAFFGLSVIWTGFAGRLLGASLGAFVLIVGGVLIAVGSVLLLFANLRSSKDRDVS